MHGTRHPSVTTLFMALTAVFGSGAQAQDYPARPITMIMPYPAGGPGDAMARNLGTALGAALKQPVVVDNPSGASGTIGSNRVAKAKPDGYTLLIMNIGMATQPALFRSLPYNVLNDFETIGRVSEVPMTIVARTGLPPATLKDLIAYAKANPRKLTFGNAGLGSAAHLCALLFMNVTQTEYTEVPYKGTAPAMIDLLGGHIDLLCDQTSTTSAQIKSGGIKTYGVTSKTRVSTGWPVSRRHPGSACGRPRACPSPRSTNWPLRCKRPWWIPPSSPGSPIWAGRPWHQRWRIRKPCELFSKPKSTSGRPSLKRPVSPQTEKTVRRQ